MKLTPKLTFKSQSASSKEKFCPTNNLSTDYNTAVEGQPLHTALPGSSEFMGKTFQAAQLTHDRFFAIDHTC